MLNELIAKIAAKAIEDGLTRENMDSGNPDGMLASWIRENVAMRPDSEFYVVFLVECKICDLQAIAEGCDGVVDRAYRAASRTIAAKRSQPFCATL